MKYESCNNQITDALDAYQRAAELDPNNVHIKARLQLLRSGQAGNGIPGQSSAPLPQDVHPQAYQATGAVGPPGPQWGNSSQQPAPSGPPVGPPVNGWGSRLAEINPPPHPANPYDQREPGRGPGQIPPPPRVPSPRQPEQMRPYPGPGPGAERGPVGPPPPPRRSPPREHHAAMGPYPGPGLPQPPPPQGPPSQPPRVSNPNYAKAGSSVLPPAQNNMNGGGPGSLPPFGRGGSPRPEVRPIIDNRMPSPKNGYPHQQPYPHHPDISNPGGIEGGAPAPASALAAAEAAAAERNGERPPSVGPKRMREWEDEPSPMKKPASDENRARMDDMHHRRPSTPPRPEQFRRSSSEARRAEEQRRLDERRLDDQRREEQRRANENYPPHTPHTPIHELPPPPPPPAPKDYPIENRERERDRAEHAITAAPQPPSEEPERAARKMDVDEDYDDDGDEDKKGGIISGPGSASGDAKAMSPAVVNGHSINGASNGQPKVEP